MILLIHIVSLGVLSVKNAKRKREKMRSLTARKYAANV